MKRLCILTLLLLSCLPLCAQTKQIARLRLQETEARDARAKLTAQLLLLREHESLFKDSLLPLALHSLSAAQALNDKTAEGYAYLGIINARLRNDQVREADSIIRLKLPHYSVRQGPDADIALRLGLAQAGIMAAKAEYEGAVAALLNIAKNAENMGNLPILCRCYNELGVISYNLNELPQALDYYRRALSFSEQNPEALQTQAYSWINMAMVYAWQEQFDTALQLLAQAIPACKRLDNLYYLANAYAVQANVYKWSGRLPQAETAMLHMVALREKTEGNLNFSNEQLGLGNFYVYAKDYPKAIATYQAGLAYHEARRAAGMPPNYELLLRYYEGLSKAYASTADNKAYLLALKQIIALKDSVAAKSSTEAIAEMQAKYEVQKKETTIIAQKLALTRKNFLFYGSLILSLLFVLIGWLLFRAYRRKSRLRLEEEKRLAATAVKDAEEAERRRIAADLHDNLGSYAAGIKSHADELKRSAGVPSPALQLLQENAQQMVSLLSDTIWAMRRPSMNLSELSDRIKLFLQRQQNNYPQINMQVSEDISETFAFSPTQSYHLLMMVQEAVNNALRHSRCRQLLLLIHSSQDWFITIHDDGIGMDAEALQQEGGNGLSNMKLRAGNIPCQIEWQTGTEGTEIQIRSR
ncbi:MAG: tetratricopeptide repeat protein [Bacteroidetes bacterium]|nr:tetratricopeptide repeat protein [Bacteroidota bacterium]